MYCKKEACAKIGTSKGNIFQALFGKTCWNKREIYVCEKHYLSEGTSLKWAAKRIKKTLEKEINKEVN